MYSLSIGTLGGSLSSTTYALSLFNLIYWCRLTWNWERNRNLLAISQEEYFCWVFLSGLALYSTWVLVAAMLWPMSNWREVEEELLVTYALGQLGFTVIVTVLPGRIARMNAVVSSEMLSLKQVFVRYVSHEIRSPLNVVHAGLDLLRTELKQMLVHISSMDDTMELLEDIFAASGSAISILNDLLNYEHIDAGTFKLEMDYVPLLRLFDDKLNWARLMARSKEVVFSVEDATDATESGFQSSVDRNRLSDVSLLERMEVGDSAGTSEGSDAFCLNGMFARIDAGKIDQVLRNLLTNAIKFTPAKKSVKVGISYRRLPATNAVTMIRAQADVVGYVRVEVTDTGVGIAAENQGKLFGEFSQFNRNELQGGEGSGLGLWISRRIIDLHQGTMGFLSEGEGCGSTFFFELPLFSSRGKSSDIEVLLAEDQRRLRQVQQHQHWQIKKMSPEKMISESRDQLLQLSSSATPIRQRIFHNLSNGNSPDSNSVAEVRFNNFVDKFCLQPSSSDKKAPIIADEIGDYRRELNLADVNRNLFPSNMAIGKSFSNTKVYPTLCFSDEIPKVTSVVEDASANNFKSMENSIMTSMETKVDSDRINKKINILVVDDSHLNRKIVRRILESAKSSLPQCEIVEADDGSTAIQEMKKLIEIGSNFDFVLIDFVMITINGPEAAFIMRNNLRYEGIIIGITGNALKEDIATFIKSGVNEVIIKPLTQSKLLNCLMPYQK